MQVTSTPALVINAPEFFADPDFMAWLNNENMKFTWHTRGKPAHDFSDVVVAVDPSLTGEGTDSDMPEHIWVQIVQACKDHVGPQSSPQCHILVRLTNLDA